MKKKKTNKKVVFNKKNNGLFYSNLLFDRFDSFRFSRSIGSKFDSIEKYFKKKNTKKINENIYHCPFNLNSDNSHLLV